MYPLKIDSKILEAVTAVFIKCGLIPQSEECLLNVGNSLDFYIKEQGLITWEQLKSNYSKGVKKLGGGKILIEGDFLQSIQGFINNYFTGVTYDFRKGYLRHDYPYPITISNNGEDQYIGEVIGWTNSSRTELTVRRLHLLKLGNANWYVLDIKEDGEHDLIFTNYTVNPSGTNLIFTQDGSNAGASYANLGGDSTASSYLKRSPVYVLDDTKSHFTYFLGQISIMNEDKIEVYLPKKATDLVLATSDMLDSGNYANGLMNNKVDYSVLTPSATIELIDDESIGGGSGDEGNTDISITGKLNNSGAEYYYYYR